MTDLLHARCWAASMPDKIPALMFQNILMGKTNLRYTNQLMTKAFPDGDNCYEGSRLRVTKWKGTALTRRLGTGSLEE